MALKDIISPPLEAGPSVLDSHRLPSHLDAALEYTARRLARKALSIDLIVIRRHYQLPGSAVSPPVAEFHDSVSFPAKIATSSAAPVEPLVLDNSEKPLPPLPSPCISEVSSSSSAAVVAHAAAASQHAVALPLALASPPPSRSRFTSAIKSLVRGGTLPSLKSPQSASFSSSASSSSPTTSTVSTSSAAGFQFSPMFSPPLTASSVASTSAVSGASYYPSSASMPSTPATPLTPALTVDSCSGQTTTTTSSVMAAGIYDHTLYNNSNPVDKHSTGYNGYTTCFRQSCAAASSASHDAAFGIRLVHADSLPPKHEKILNQILTKAARKYHVSPRWLAPSTSAIVSGIPADLPHHSLDQNNVIFAAPGLTLRSLDHLYTFKAALASYAASGNQYRLEDAVDELRRYVLARGGQRLGKRELLRRYPALQFAESDLADVVHMYSRAYGGPGHDIGIESDGLSSCAPSLVMASDTEEDDSSSNSSSSESDSDSFTSSEAEQALLDLLESKEMAIDGMVSHMGGYDESDSESLSEVKEILLDGGDEDEDDDVNTPIAQQAGENTAATEAPPEPLRSAPSVPPEAEETPASPTLASLLLNSSLLPIFGMTRRRHRLKAHQSEEDLKTEEPKKEESNKETNKVEEESKTPVKGDDEDDDKTPTDRTKANSKLIPAVMATSILRKPIASKLPLLKLQTTFDKPSVPPTLAVSASPIMTSAVIPILLEEEEEAEKKNKPAKPTATGEDEEQLTARPVSCVRQRKRFSWSTTVAPSIGELLSTGGPAPVHPIHQEVVPMTPNDYDDISPITRSEWGFLMGGQSGRQVTVTTF